MVGGTHVHVEVGQVEDDVRSVDGEVAPEANVAAFGQAAANANGTLEEDAAAAADAVGPMLAVGAGVMVATA